jgi:hypothetical protein
MVMGMSAVNLSLSRAASRQQNTRTLTANGTGDRSNTATGERDGRLNTASLMNNAETFGDFVETDDVSEGVSRRSDMTGNEGEKEEENEGKQNEEEEEDDESSDDDLINNSFIRRIKGTPGLGKKVISITTQAQHDYQTTQNTTTNTNSFENSAVNSAVHTAEPSPSELLIPWSESEGGDLFYSKKRDSRDFEQEKSDFTDKLTLKPHGIAIIDAKSGVDLTPKSSHKTYTHKQPKQPKITLQIDTNNSPLTTTEEQNNLISPAAAGEMSKFNSFTASLSPSKSFKGSVFNEDD